MYVIDIVFVYKGFCFLCKMVKGKFMIIIYCCLGYGKIIYKILRKYRKGVLNIVFKCFGVLGVERE